VHHGFDPEALASQLKTIGFTEMAHRQCFVIRKESGADAIREYAVFLLLPESNFFRNFTEQYF